MLKSELSNTLKLWKRLLTGKVPVNKPYLTGGTVPVNKEYLTGTVPVNKVYLTDTLFLSISW